MNHLHKAIAFLLLFGSVNAAFGQKPGDLIIAPTKVLLDDKNHSSDINLVNTGSQPIRYRLSIVDMEMSEEGGMKRIPSSETSAAGILRLSPREVLLQPGVSQRIKIAAFLPSGMPDKELRSHLSFEQITMPKTGAAPSDAQEEGLSIRLNVRSVVTIPVIVRHGKLTADVAIADASVENGKDGSSARFKLIRTGTRSVRGDVVVTFVPAGQGQKVVLGRIVGLPVYCPNADRIVTIKLSTDVRSLGKGDVEISFAEPGRSRGAATARSVVELLK